MRGFRALAWLMLGEAFNALAGLCSRVGRWAMARAVACDRRARALA